MFLGKVRKKILAWQRGRTVAEGRLVLRAAMDVGPYGVVCNRFVLRVILSGAKRSRSFGEASETRRDETEER